MSAALPLSIQTAWLIPLYGFSGMLLSLPWATGLIKRQGPRPAAYLNLLVTLLAVIHGTVLISTVLSIGPQHLDLAWFQAADLDLHFGFDLNFTNLAALELVTGISLIGQIFALGYLDKEWSLARFFALIGFFEGAMAGVVLSSNLFMSYFLLEMLTLSTYLLVGFWYAQPLVVTAARDAFLTKRVGDVLLLMGMVALSSWAGSLEFGDLYIWAGEADLSPVAAALLGLALMAGPMGKCAQFPMHLWLDEAMEGPNPASIMRNSVVVTCGAVVLLKLMPVLHLSPIAVNALLLVGSISALGGALVAIAQVDLKRAFSYSTTSYLGLVFIAIALEQPLMALLLLFSHALAKALLFMSVGSVIATTNCQDITELGGLGNRMPATTAAYLAAAAALTGLVPLGCFWSFGLLLEAFQQRSPLFAAVLLITNGLTVFNLVRVFRQVFLDRPHPKTRRAPEVNWLMALPMVSMLVIVLIAPLAIDRLPALQPISDLSGRSVALLTTSGLFGLICGCLISLDKFWSRSVFRPLRVVQDLLAYDFYTDRIYRATIVAAIARLAAFTNAIDQLLLNRFSDRVGRFALASAESLRLGVSGQMQSYVLTVLLSLVLLLTSLSWIFG